MPKLVVGVALLLAVASIPDPASAQAGIAIEHKAVDCIVAGKFPKMSSCFAPTGEVARARVYFRPEGVESWYYVEMKSDAPCLAGILPRPRKELVGKHVNYYVQATDRSFNEARTAEHSPLVVDSESECKDKPVAPFLSKASVKVFPGLPAGFAAGGAATLPIIGGVVVAGGAAAGVAAASGDSNPPASSTTLLPTTTAPATTTTTTTTTTSTTQPSGQGFRFVFRVFPDPPRGLEPLRVTIDMCRSTPANQLRYYFNFDGGSFDFIGNQCSQTRTLSGAGASGGLPPTTTLPPQPRVPREFIFPLRGCAELRDNPATQQCGDATARVTEDISLGAAAAVRIKPMRPDPGSAARRLSWASELDIEGGAGQIIANGQSAVFAGRGRSNAIATGRRGDNRIEAQLVQAGGKPGTWRFELAATSSLVPGSLRVIAGEVAAISGDSISFRLKGTPGERVVFSFKTAR
jgi:hypothetical protein